MIEIKEVEKESIAQGLGISKGDRICSINGCKIRDEIDLIFYESDSNLMIEIEKDKKRRFITARKLPEVKLGIKLVPFEFKRCNNSCIFCFYDQMPKGLRESLYQKDDDYRLSFLYGNYITLTNMIEEDYKRIEEQRLSPLYVSVHSTNPDVRAQMLGRDGKEVDTQKPLKRLADAKIAVHTQIVICPGINDGERLEKTVFELSQFFPYVRSIAIIPVGLTKHRRGLFPLRALTQKECLEVIKNIFRWQEDFRKRFGIGFVYPSDEILITAEFAVPMKEFYDEFPQLENGVGNSRIFLDDIEEINIMELNGIKSTIVFITSHLPFPWVNLLRKRLLLETSIICDIFPIENSLFGESVTVSGLLVGMDILTAIKAYEKKADLFIIPSNCLNEDGLFLDDISLSDLTQLSGRRVIATPSPISVLPETIRKEFIK